jgi:hypothetical protein
MKKVTAVLSIFLYLMPIDSKADWFSSTKSIHQCIDKKSDICISAELPNNMNSYEKQSFVVTLDSKVLINDLNVSLWMHMDCGERSHPGAPVTVQQIDTNRFLVTNAHFFMIGKWEVVVRLSANQFYEIRIPIEIKL